MLANISPELYQLEDLMKSPLPGYYYGKQLTPTQAPNYKKDYFLIEKYLKTKTIKGQKFHLAKYLYYPNKFATWVSDKDVITGASLNSN